MKIVADMQAIDPTLANEMRDRILAIPDTEWFKYDNPFEHKTAMGFDACVRNANDSLYYVQAGLGHWLTKKTNLPLRCDTGGYFSSIFKYEPGDYLQPHLDARLHPFSPARKRITVLLYLSTDDLLGGTLNFYFGDGKPEKLVHSWEPKFNTLIAFENTENAWHGCDEIVRGTKIVVTSSYFTDDEEDSTITRRKAYFAPAPGVTWSDEILELRDKRADPKSAPEIYVQR